MLLPLAESPLPRTPESHTRRQETAVAISARQLWKGPKFLNEIPDRRMRDLAHTICEEPDNWQRIRAKIQTIGLSSAYLSVRFMECVGMPMRSYALWKKFEHGLERVLDGARPSDAAIDAGFADQSHLGRAARRFAKKSFWKAVAELKEDMASEPVSSVLQKSSSAAPSSTNPS